VVKKSEKYGMIGSVILTLLLFLLLFLIVMPGLKTPEDEGIMISFGETFDGGGASPIPKPKVTPVEQPKETQPKPTTPKVVKNDYVTQKDNSVAIEEQKKKDKKEKEALEKQKLEEQRKAAEKKRKEQEAIDKTKSMDGLFGNGGSTGSGNTTGNTAQGNPAGAGTSGGNSWSLSGRSLTGRLVAPSYDKDLEGRITVTIRVDANGNVISASIGSPTNISDPTTRNAAITAARNTKFTAGNGNASGSITYNFKLR